MGYPPPLNRPIAQQVGLGVQPGQPAVLQRIIIVPGSLGGIYVYSPTVALGNLIESDGIPADTTDAKGNAVLAGATSYGPAGGLANIRIAVQRSDNAVTWYTALTGAGPWVQQASLGFAGILGGVGGILLALGTNGMEITGGPVYGLGGAWIGSATAIHPGSSHTAETPQAMTLLNSWANFGPGNVGAQYWLTPGGEARVLGIISHASISGASTIATLPTGYAPANTAMRDWALSNTGLASLLLSTNGNLTLEGLPASTTTVFLNCSFPLNALDG